MAQGKSQRASLAAALTLLIPERVVRNRAVREGERALLVHNANTLFFVRRPRHRNTSSGYSA